VVVDHVLPFLRWERGRIAAAFQTDDFNRA
jgi:hypothetical protein